MSSTTSALLIAFLGIVGTLASALLTQHSANNSKRRELEHADRQRREEREYQARQEAVEARRACYVALNTAARLFLTELANYLYDLQAGKPTDAAREKVEEARREHRARHAEAQMIVPDPVLTAAREVNSQLGALYGVLKRIDSGSPEEGETVEEADDMRLKAWEPIATMRTVMRRDLGIAP